MRSIRPAGSNTVEGTARVVRVEGNVVWLEPEQTGSCGSCASAASCASKGIGTLASRLEARRFAVDNTAGLTDGERVVMGIQEAALVQAALLAYGLPLAAMLGAAAAAQWIAATEALVPLAAATGLAVGLGMAHLGARHLAAQGGIAPRVLRRAEADCAHGERDARP